MCVTIIYHYRYALTPLLTLEMICHHHILHDSKYRKGDSKSNSNSI